MSVEGSLTTRTPSALGLSSANHSVPQTTWNTGRGELVSARCSLAILPPLASGVRCAIKAACFCAA